MVHSRRMFLRQAGLAGIGLSFTGALGACSRGKPARSLNLYTWDTYIGKNTVADFTKAAGAGVNISLFANNDELFAKLRSGNQGYDVIVPSNDFVERMHAAGMLTELDHAKIPNLKNIAPQFLNPPFDPGRRVSVPYTWIVTGIGFYDGFFGPGAGQFYTTTLVALRGMGLTRATGLTKLLNVTSNLASVIVFALGGHVLWLLGLCMGAGAMTGAIIGSHFATRFGARLIRPLLIVVSLALTGRLVWQWFAG